MKSESTCAGGFQCILILRTNCSFKCLELLQVRTFRGVLGNCIILIHKPANTDTAGALRITIEKSQAKPSSAEGLV